jgi:hypothetical protein
VRGAGGRPAGDAGLAGEVVGRLTEALEQVLELALYVVRRVDTVEQHLGAFDDPVGCVGQELHAVVHEVVGTAAGLLDDPIALGLRFAPDELGVTLCVAEQTGGLCLGGTEDRLHALGGIPGQVPVAKSVHPRTVSPQRSRQNRRFV